MSTCTRRGFLKMTAASAAAATLSESLPAAALVQPQESVGVIDVRVTAADRRYAPANPMRWHAARGDVGDSTIVLQPTKKFQPILGFGAALTDAACYVISGMREDAREQLLQELFHPKQLGFNACRLCIGSSDYATTTYSYDEGEPDPELRRFSIEHDRAYIMPTIQRARQINPDLFLLGSPWSPPNWMKDNNSMLGGTIRRRYLEAYAKYIVKFLEAYKREGCEVNAVTPQNEVDTDQDSRMPACLFPQEAEVQYVGEHLGPAIERAGLKTQIWLIDHNYNLWGRAIGELDDLNVRKYTKSIAWHGYLGRPEWIQKVLEAHPDAEMYWTEGGPNITHPNYQRDWSRWSKVFTEILRNGPRCIIAWNLALDETGKPNIGPFSCGGVVTVHSHTNETTRSGQYWAFAHYSRAMQRNAVVIGSQGDFSDVHHVAVMNSDGRYAAVLTNTGKTLTTVELRLGSSTAEATLPADSVTTLTWR